MKDFFIPKDLLLFSNNMGMNSDFSVRGFSTGVVEAMATLTVTVAGGALWTPAEITGALWFDPDSADYRVLDVSAVSSLTDVISGVVTVSQTTTSNKPTLIVSDINGCDVASLDGGDWLSGTIPAAGGNPIEIFAVWMTSAPSVSNVLCMLGTASARAGFGMGHNPATGGYNTFIWADAERYLTGTTGRYVMESAQRNASGLRVGLDGTLSPYASANLTLSSGALNIGRGADGLAHVTGKLAALVIGVFDDATIAKLYGWAAHKYGLSANLPTDHLYKSAPPTI